MRYMVCFLALALTAAAQQLPPAFENVTVHTHRVDWPNGRVYSAVPLGSSSLQFVSVLDNTTALTFYASTTTTFLDLLQRFDSGPARRFNGRATAFVIIGTPATVPALNASIPVLTAGNIFSYTNPLPAQYSPFWTGTGSLAAPYGGPQGDLVIGSWARPGGGSSDIFAASIFIPGTLASVAGMTFHATVVLAGYLADTTDPNVATAIPEQLVVLDVDPTPYVVTL